MEIYDNKWERESSPHEKVLMGIAIGFIVFAGIWFPGVFVLVGVGILIFLTLNEKD